MLKEKKDPTVIDIWRYTWHVSDAEAEKQQPWLALEEQQKADRFLQKKDRLKYIANHRFMRQVLAFYVRKKPEQIIFRYSPLGKPFLTDDQLHFSLSYRNQCGLLAVCEHREVGVDIEFEKELQDVHTFSEYSFTQEEKKLIFKNKVANREVLFTFWTFKEAYIKATGTGLSVDISKINLAGFFNQETNKVQGSEWTLNRLPAEAGYRAAYAIAGKKPTCREFDFRQHF